MELNKIPAAVQNPSGFGMPACGHDSVAAAGFGATAGFRTTGVVRERATAVIADVKGDMDLAYTQGTSAWSPPLS